MGGGCLRGGREDREVHHPAAGDAEVEAQARTEGRDEDDVWKGGAGGSKKSQQGGQGLRRQEPEGLHLRCLSPLSTALCPLGPARQCCSWSCHAARFAEVQGAAGRLVSTGARSILVHSVR